jgi:hypothetical protein
MLATAHVVAQFEGLQAKGSTWMGSFLAMLIDWSQQLGTIALIIIGLSALFNIARGKPAGDMFSGGGSGLGNAKSALLALVLIGAAGFLASEALGLGGSVS